jgi:hypothetical protein
VAEGLSISQIVAEELQHTPVGRGDATASAWTETDDAQLQATLGRDAYLELMAATEELIMRELEQHGEGALDAEEAANGEAAAAVHEYEAYLAAEAESAREAEALLAEGSTDAVLCPLCARGTLIVAPDGIVVCTCSQIAACPLRLDARGHPAPIDVLRERMDALITEHSRHCDGLASCRLPTLAEQQQGLGMLLFCCSTCNARVGVV